VVESDLRLISLTPTICKVLESFVGRRMLAAIADKFDIKHFGALRGRSTTHALIDILRMWHEALDKRQSVRAVFVDYAKAFDHADHAIILHKLHDMGAPEFVIRFSVAGSNVSRLIMSILVG